jgi:hypothetical protein
VLVATAESKGRLTVEVATTKAAFKCNAKIEKIV